MTLHEITVAAGARLRFQWELHGVAIDPAPIIRQIAIEMAFRQPQVRQEVEMHLQDEWARLCDQEGVEE